jgi:[ribosomal protein S18]-alanine N-acetyltransferase
VNSTEFQYSIRRMKLEDVEQVHQLDVISFSLPWPERSFRYELTENLSSRMWVVETAIETGIRVIGMLGLWLIVDEVHIGTLAIHPDFRKQGIAQRLLITSLLAACKEGAAKAYLEVRKGNLAAQALYTKFGFKISGIRPRYYSNNGEDALMMTLDPMIAKNLAGFIEE